MSLIAGTKLGSYEVLVSQAPEEWETFIAARDTKLNRDVALKVLPERLPRILNAWRASSARG